MHCPTCEAALPDNVDVCFACGGPVRGWMTAPARRRTKKQFGKRVGAAYEPPAHLRLFSTKLLVGIAARLMMLVISAAFLTGLGLAVGGKHLRDLKDLKHIDFAHQAKAAYQQIADVFTGR